MKVKNLILVGAMTGLLLFVAACSTMTTDGRKPANAEKKQGCHFNQDGWDSNHCM